MEYRQLGRTGLNVNAAAIGSMNYGGSTDRSTAPALIDRALDAGVNFVDTANIYNLGRANGSSARRSPPINDAIVWCCQPKSTSRWTPPIHSAAAATAGGMTVPYYLDDAFADLRPHQHRW